jgi:iron complex transport system substrate-binding protein
VFGHLRARCPGLNAQGSTLNAPRVVTIASRLWPLAFLALVTLGCRPGAAPQPQTVAAASPALAVTDDSGRRVEIPQPVERIVSLNGAHTETLYALELGDRLVAADSYSDYPSEVQSKATLRCWPKPPVEQIVALRPDLVLVLTEDDEFLRRMDALKIPALKLFPQGFDEALERIELIGRVTGAETEAERLTDEMRADAEAVRQRVRGARRKRVMFEMDAADPARPFVAGKGGFYDELLTIAGGENVFADMKPAAVQTSTEQVVARDPEVILLGDTQSPVHPQKPEAVGRRPGWGSITAVRRGQVYPVNSERITRPGPRLTEGLEAIARALHPDRFQ